MRVEDVRSERLRKFINALGGRQHFLHEYCARDADERCAWRRGPVKLPAFGFFYICGRPAVSRCRDLQRLPTAVTLAAQDAERAKRVAAVQGKRVIENVQNAHRPTRPG